MTSETVCNELQTQETSSQFIPLFLLNHEVIHEQIAFAKSN